MKMVLKDFYEKCIFISIINAVMTLENPEFCSLNSWSDNNYNKNDWEGTRVTVSFYKDGCVASCRDEKSKRLNSYTEADYYFKDAPQQVYDIAKNETLQYLLNKVDDKIVPLITTAFWIVDNTLHSIDNQNDMINNGMNILNKELFMDISEIVEDCIEDYDMTYTQIEFSKYLFDLKLMSKNSPIHIVAKDFPDIFIESEDYSVGIESLNEIGITVM